MLFTYAKTEVSKKSKNNLKKNKKKAKKKDKKQKNKKNQASKNKKPLRIKRSLIKAHFSHNSINKNNDDDNHDELNNEATEHGTRSHSNHQNDDNDNENSMISASHKFLSTGLINSELDKYKKLAKYEREIKEKQNMQLKSEKSKLQEDTTNSQAVEQKTNEKGKSTKRSIKRLTSTTESLSQSSSLLSSSLSSSFPSLTTKENKSKLDKTKTSESKSAIKKVKTLGQFEMKFEQVPGEKVNSLKLINNTLNESSESENEAELKSTSVSNEKCSEQTDKQQKPKEKVKKPRKSKLNDSTNASNADNAASTSILADNVGLKKRGRKPKSFSNADEMKNMSINQIIANKTNKTLGDNLLEKFNTQIKSQLILNSSESPVTEERKMVATPSYLMSKLDVTKPCINPALSSFMKPQINANLNIQPPVVRVLPNLNLKPINSLPMISKNTINSSSSNPTTIYITKKTDQPTISNSLNLPINLQLNSNLNTQNKVIIKAAPTSTQFVKSSNGMLLLNQNVTKPSLPVNMGTQKILSISKPTFVVAPNQILLSNQLNIPTTSKFINLTTLTNSNNINNSNNDKTTNL